jgi:hypothetical protein
LRRTSIIIIIICCCGGGGGNIFASEYPAKTRMQMFSDIFLHILVDENTVRYAPQGQQHNTYLSTY